MNPQVLDIITRLNLMKVRITDAGAHDIKAKLKCRFAPEKMIHAVAIYIKRYQGITM